MAHNNTAGTVGTPLVVITNSFVIKTLPQKTFYHYDAIQRVPDNPDKPVPIPLYRQIIDGMQTQYSEFFTPLASFDGRKNLYRSGEIRRLSFEVKAPGATRANAPRYLVTLSAVNNIEPEDFQNLTKPGGADLPVSAVAVNVLQIALSQAPNIRHHFGLRAKSFFIRSSAVDIAPGIQAWRGFFQSVRPTIGRVLVNVDTATAAFYTPGPILDIAITLMGYTDSRKFCQDLNAGGDRSSKILRHLRYFYRNTKVTISEQCGGRGREVRIDDIIPNGGAVEFIKNGHAVTVQDYFLSTHNKHLVAPGAFGIKNSRGCVFPAEVCTISPGQFYKKKLEGNAAAEFLKKSTQKPRRRLQDIRDAVSDDRLGYGVSSYMLAAGLSVSADPLRVAGRLLPPPTVYYANGRTASIRNGAWNVVNQRFVKPAEILAWAVVDFNHDKDFRDHIALSLFRNMKKLGIVIQREEPAFYVGNPSDVERSLTEGAFQSVKDIPRLDNGNSRRPGFVLVILPRDALALRIAVKRWSSSKNAITVQCVRANNGPPSKYNDQYCNNLALKINMRCGGINHYVRSRSSALLQDTMVVGCDVGHPSPGVTNRPSIASLVASVDENATRYVADVRVQAPRQETIIEIGDMIKNAIINYKSAMKKFPKCILLFRDGVSEGEFGPIEHTEIKAIQDQLDDLQRARGDKVSLVFIAVGKRHHVRFFPSDPVQGDGTTGNLCAGFIADTQIVSGKYPQFYLQSHGARQGTPRPAHYTVLKNTAGWNVDQLQDLSNMLCYVYASATLAVSIPAPVYYADRVCALAAMTQFKQHLAYDDDDASTNGGRGECDLAKWQAGFERSHLAGAMYFL